MNAPRTITSSWTINIDVPRVPNFFIERLPDDSSRERGKYPICDFNDETLREIGAAWTEKLIERAEEMRQEKRKGLPF